jgi:diguanylate cyclase (GGDEF)-like protein
VTRVLVADDDEDIRHYLQVTLELEGFEPLLARDGVEAMEIARTQRPDVVVLDVMMPRLDGYAVLSALREDPRTSHLPVLMLTALSQRRDAIEGLKAGADDYLTKPFDAEELVARIVSALRRSDQQRTRNPLTGLPGNDSILRELGDRLSSQRPMALLYVDLDQFKPFNDHYGFLRGDEALRTVAHLLIDVRDETNDQDVFVGHVGGDDFVMICHPDIAEKLAQAICDRFDALAPSLYDPADREAGSIEVPDRRGIPQRFGLLSLSIGIASTERREIAHQGEMVAIATELKRYAKSHSGDVSNYAIDRRHDGTEGLDLEVDLP